ncbi:MAG TPA: tRNA epoxyqueuosine(34) reductase QueG [Gemmatimonadaceae bacterium]|nr:tRNA epoxyqueuosine(34) reductase QueG [Gemmatimonadaceae bacterium]
MDATSSTLELRIKRRANELGFDPVGITRLGAADTHEQFLAWLERGYAGDMHYLERGAARRADTRLPFEGVRSAVVVALDYGGRERTGAVARYARGDDYHDVMVDRLNALHGWIARESGHEIRGKAYVDTGPILERDLARRAGLGWIGKNTMLVNPRRGSFFFLGALLLDLELDADAPFDADRCGTCTRCLDACPTDAFVAPHIMDARRCISYLTIEHRGDIAPELRPLVGDLLYGCDICQDVCPWNVRFASDLETDSPFAARPAIAGKDAATQARDLLAMSDEEFGTEFRGSPMKRAKLRGLKRNAAVVLENSEPRT